MTNLELVEHDLTPCGNGRPVRRTVVAMSSSYSALERHCKETYKTEVGEKDGYSMETYYTIHESKGVIVPSKF